jgi:hypothetical protein
MAHTILVSIDDDQRITTIIDPPAPEPVVKFDPQVQADRDALALALAGEKEAHAAEIVELRARIAAAEADAVDDSIRQYCRTLGDYTQRPWGLAPGWAQATMISGVRRVMDGKTTTPDESHASWMAEKLEQGWVYGPEKNADAKTHPCLVPFAELPIEQQVKDHLFLSIAKTLLAAR